VDSTLPPFFCPVCGSQFDGTIVAHEISKQGTVSVQRCPGCGLHVTYPRLDNPQAGYITMSAAEWDKKYGQIERGERLHDRHRNYQEEVAFVEHYLAQNARVLDVGCNAGWLLGYLQQSPKQFALEGVEPSKLLSGIARRRLGIPIHNGFAHDLVTRRNDFDGITATDVIEHILPEQVGQFVDDLCTLLKPGGYVFIKTPNTRYVAFKSRIARRTPDVLKRRLLRTADVWDAKEHVTLWDANTLTRHFTQHGFQIVRLFVPLPVQTRGSSRLTVWLRGGLYYMARFLGGVPFFAQDIFLVAQKRQENRG
jgi:2-polyprenyl-3-methyl-5-hydroxy-6-metoxy-1,4-benzoquinol methylase